MTSERRLRLVSNFAPLFESVIYNNEKEEKKKSKKKNFFFTVCFKSSKFVKETTLPYFAQHLNFLKLMF